ncbi:hypothetical protein [Burkholderia gladioli]|uniref:hypothetical protein n=1 Tax=Burkholderia gladioli TaxID=28095 RepID=UPI0016414E1A|nr:hypothetical protein [Burkholderia gladioli]
MGYYVSDLGEAIEDYNLALKRHHDGKISEDDVDAARKEVVHIAQSIYFDDGKFDKTVYQMHKPNGALITVERGQVYVQVDDANDPNEIENLHIPSPGPDRF